MTNSGSKHTALSVVVFVITAATLGPVMVGPAAAGHAANGYIAGQVTDGQGSGVSGAPVYIVNTTSGNLTTQVTTDASGNYNASVHPDKYAVVVDASGYETKFKPSVRVTSGNTTTVDVQLQETPGTGFINGTLVDSNGNSVANAQISAVDSSYRYSASDTTDANGNFSLKLPAGSYTVRANAQDFPPIVKQGITVSENQTTQRTLTLQAAGYINGTVLDASGNAPKRAFVVVDTPNGFQAGPVDSKTGQYNVTVPPGNHTVTVFGQSVSAPSKEVAVSAGQANETDFTLLKTSIVHQSVEKVSGPGTESELGVRAAIQAGFLQVQVVNESNAGPGLGAPSELEGTGVNESTTLRINLTAQNFTPNSLLWGLDNANWSTSDNTTIDNGTDITITGSPATMQVILDKQQKLPLGPLTNQDPSEVNWATGRNDRADAGRNETIYIGLFDLSTMPSNLRNRLSGMSVTTNAQAFSMPRVDNNSLNVWVAAPTATVEGLDHNGFYQAEIPQAQLDDWGIDDPVSELNALYKGDSANFTVTNTSSGARIRLDNISYSAGTVEIQATPAGSTDAGATGVSHKFSMTLESGDDDFGRTLQATRLKFPAWFDLTGVSLDDVTVEQNGTPRNVTSISKSGTNDTRVTVTVDNGTEINASSPDVNMTVSNVTNPSTSATYGVTMTVNPGSSTSVIIPLAIGGGGSNELPRGTQTDNTVDSNTTRNRMVEVADVNYGTSGNVSAVQVDISEGNDSTANATDVSDVRVQLYNQSTQNVVSSRSLSYSQDPVIANFSGSAAETGDEVDRVRIIATVSGSAEHGLVLDANYTIQGPSGTVNTTDTDGAQTILVTNTGFIRGEVQNEDGNELEGVTVDIVDQSSNVIIESRDTDADGQFGNVRAAPGDYIIRIEEPGFEAFSQSARLDANGTIDMPVTLVSNRFADNLSVSVWEAGSQTAGGDDSTLLADGESGTSVTYVVYAEDNLNNPLNSSLDVTLSFDNDPTVGDLVDNDTIETSTMVTIPTDQTADVDGDGSLESYALIEVTSDNATQSTFDDVGHTGPIRTEPFTASATNSEGTTLTDPGNVSYVLEGEKSISGHVRDRSGEDIEDADVWVAYETAGNHSMAYTADTFVNEDGESFLVTETDDEGNYVIHGLAGDDTNVTVYVAASGYNRENLTDTNNVGQFVASSQDVQTAGAGDTTQEVDHVLTSIEVVLEYRLTLTGEVSVDEQPPEWDESIRMPIEDSRDLNLTIEVKTTTEPDSAFTPIEDSELVDDVNVTFNVTTERSAGDLVSGDTGPANEIEVPVSESEDEGLVRFDSQRSTGTPTVEASVTNSNETTFSDSMDIEVFGIGQVSGDIANEDDQVLPFADVEILQLNKTSDEYETYDTTEAGPEGHYSFGNVETGFEYRVEATFEGRTGFADFNKTAAGTTTADVVVQDAPSVSFQVTTFDDVSAESGDTATVSATIENIGEESGTTDVTLSVNGTDEGTQSITLAGGATETVTFDVDTTDLDAGDYTMTMTTDDDTESATLTITNDSGSASAHLSAADSDGDGQISDTEVLGAIGEWRDDTGADYTDIEILDIIDHWRTGDAV